MSNQILIGTGALSWSRYERQDQRYGSVSVFNQNSDDEIITTGAELFVDQIKKHVGRKGKLICDILETRKSTHTGDKQYKIYPKTPNVSDKIELGTGELFLQIEDYGTYVGLKPNDGRHTLWLDIQNLYNAHEQTVNLYFEPIN